MSRHTRGGCLSLVNSFVDIDGDLEIGDKVFRCDNLHLKGDSSSWRLD